MPVSSAAQTINTNQVYDYEYRAGDPTSLTAVAASNQKVYLTLFTNQAITTSPIVNLVPLSVVVSTDSNGFWQAQVVPASAFSPSSYWLVQTPSRTFRITGAAGQASQTLAT